MTYEISKSIVHANVPLDDTCLLLWCQVRKKIDRLDVVRFTIRWMMLKSIGVLITCTNFVPGLGILSTAECIAHVDEILLHHCRHEQLNWQMFRMISLHCTSSITFITGFKILELKKVQGYMLNLKPQVRYHFHEECTTVSFGLLSDYCVYSMDTLSSDEVRRLF